MKRYVLVLAVALLLCFKTGFGQSAAKNDVYNAQFKWHISVPEHFTKVNAEEWARLQNKGAQAIEKTYNEKVVNEAKTIFAFKSDQLNYFESNYQPFDPKTDGSYLASCKNVDDILYHTFETQIPGAKIDTVISKETVDNLVFQTLKMKITLPNNKILNVLMFSRLFGKHEFSVNILYLDEERGAAMLKSWRASKFGKN